jgi:hypothetical protein
VFPYKNRCFKLGFSDERSTWNYFLCSNEKSKKKEKTWMKIYMKSKTNDDGKQHHVKGKNLPCSILY